MSRSHDTNCRNAGCLQIPAQASKPDVNSASDAGATQHTTAAADGGAVGGAIGTLVTLQTSDSKAAAADAAADGVQHITQAETQNKAVTSTTQQANRKEMLKAIVAQGGTAADNANTALIQTQTAKSATAADMLTENELRVKYPPTKMSFSDLVKRYMVVAQQAGCIITQTALQNQLRLMEVMHACQCSKC